MSLIARSFLRIAKFEKQLKICLRRNAIKPVRRPLLNPFKYTLGAAGLICANNAFVLHPHKPILQTPKLHVAKSSDPLHQKILNLLSKILRSIKVIGRCCILAMIFSPVVTLYPISYLSRRGNDAWWKLLIFSLEMAGPVFIKLGQWASTRRDLFSEEFCNKLSKLQHNTSPHSWKETEVILNKSFGEDWKQLFEDVDRVLEPIGSGCVAQVYKVFFKKQNLDLKANKLLKSRISHEEDATSIPVALKVLHPGIQDKIKQDLSILHSFANCLETLVPRLKWMSVIDCVHVFNDFMLSQVDLCREAALLDKFIENFQSESHIIFPTPIKPFIREMVLIETWETGIPLTEYLMNKDKCLSSEKVHIAKLGINLLLKMVFKDNLVHADLHPGNIMVVTSDSNFKDYPKLVILDCGLTSSLSADDFLNFHQVFKAVVKGNGAEVAKLFLDNSISECQDPSKFSNQMEKIVDDARNGTLKLSKINVTKLLNDVFTLLTYHKVKLESNFLSVILAIVILEGLGKTLDPKMDILQCALPFLI